MTLEIDTEAVEVPSPGTEGSGVTPDVVLGVPETGVVPVEDDTSEEVLRVIPVSPGVGVEVKPVDR